MKTLIGGFFRKHHLHLILVLLGTAFTSTGCADIFQFSPFDTKTSETSVNEKSIHRIIATPHHSTDTLHIAVFADSHNYHKDLKDAVSLINNLGYIDFVISGGDITEKGLALEYEWYLDEMKKLRSPYITVIGNHDYRSNGGVVFKKLFGETNFYFDYHDYRFIGFDNVVWENNNTAPNNDWLRSVSYLTDTTRYPIVISHVLPGAADQNSEIYTPVYENIMEQNRALISISGHVHEYKTWEKNHVRYLVAGSVYYREMTIMHVYKNTVRIERVGF